MDAAHNTDTTLTDLITELHAAGTWTWTNADGETKTLPLDCVIRDFKEIAKAEGSEARLIKALQAHRDRLRS